MYAQTDLKIGIDDNVIRYDQGDVVEEGDLTPEIVDGLIEAGALADHPPLDNPDAVRDALAEKDEMIASLQAALAEQGNADLEQIKADKDAEIESLRQQLADQQAKEAAALAKEAKAAEKAAKADS